MSGSQLIPVIYTEYHFDDLKFGALQYTKDMLEKYKKLGIKITRQDIERHWRKQVAREYSDDHPLRTVLRKLVSLIDFLRQGMRNAYPLRS